jgi:CubicO group peptidase (beta-lactamase class C family)
MSFLISIYNDQKEVLMKRQTSTLLHLLILLALCACGIIPASKSPMPSPTAAIQPSRLPDPDEVKAFLVQLVDEQKQTPGMVIGMIADDPEERWVVGYGRLSATDERVPDGDTVFQIESMGKLFTGSLLAQAVLNGEAKLDDPISMYLPEGVTAPEYEGKSITLLDLATHTSGLPHMPANFHPKDPSNPFVDYTIDQMYDSLSGYRLTRAPGSTYEYSNYGFGLLGNLLVRRAGQADYEALLLERICRPLGMDSTRVQLTPELRSRLATPHLNYSVATSDRENITLAGAGGTRSTVNDQLIFLAANMGMTGTELQPALQLANTPQRPVVGKDTIGLGWQVAANYGIHWHNGGGAGYTSFLAWDAQRKVGVVVLTNAKMDVDRIGLQLIRGLPLTPVQVDPQVLAAYAGGYQYPGAPIVTLRVDDTRIFMQIPGQGEVELLASSDNQFYLPAANAEITFYKNASGKVDRLVYAEHGDTYEAKKVP